MNIRKSVKNSFKYVGVRIAVALNFLFMNEGSKQRPLLILIPNNIWSEHANLIYILYYSSLYM